MKTYRAGDILTLKRRAVTIDPLKEYEEIGVRSHGRGIFHKEPILGADLGSKRVFKILPGDLILNNVFAWEGAVAVAGPKERGKIGSHRFMTYTVQKPAEDARYLKYFFLSEFGLALLGQASPGSAGRNRTLAIDRFSELRIPLPKPPEQRRIADKLDLLIGRVEAAAERVQESDLDKLASLYPTLVDVVLARYASETSSVRELADVVSDIVHPGDDPGAADRFVGLQHIERHTGRRIGELPIGGETGRKFRFQPGDVVYGYLRPYLNKVWLADCNGLCSVDQYVLRPKGISGAVLAHTLRSRSFLAQAIDLTHSLQLPRLRSGLLADIEVRRTRREDEERALTELDSGLERVFWLLDLRRHAASLLASLQPAILNDAFDGQL